MVTPGPPPPGSGPAGPSPAQPPPGRRVPPGIRLAGVLLALEGVATVAYGVAEVASAQSGRAMLGIGAGAVLLIYGFGLALVARGLLRLRRWARGPAVATQLIHLPVAWSLRAGDLGWLAAVLAVVAVLVLVGLLLPTSTAALVRPDDTEDD